MDDVIVNASIGAGALLAGHLITRWWERARPMIVLEKFSVATKMTHRATSTAEIHNLTKKSMSVPSVGDGEIQYADLEQAYLLARRELMLNHDIDAWISNAVRLLADADTDDQVKDGVRALLRWTGLRELIEILYYRELINHTSPTQPNSDVKVKVMKSKHHDGSFIVLFSDSLARLGGGFHDEEWKEQALMPLVLAIMHLDRDYLLALAKSLRQYAVSERDVHQAIVDRIQPIRDEYTIWIAYCNIVNFGNSPVVIWPSAKLLLRPAGKWQKTTVECYLAERKPDNPKDATDLSGPTILGPGESKALWAITHKKKAELPNGNLITGYFKDASARARVRFLVTHRGLPLKSSIKSSSITFAEAADKS